MNGLEVLLLKTKPSRGEFWQPVTGSVEQGESFAQAAQREAFEETGLKLEVQPLEEKFFFKNSLKEFEEHVYYAEAERLADIRVSPFEHSEYRWVPSKDALGMLGFESNGKMLEILMQRLERK
jgi:8-oxo-dGTP pyrophosphatase MutT (NUDIX family)